jgi:predicted dehydrogenase
MARALRVGVIGTGFGSTVQIPAFRAHPRVQVVGIASGRPGRARQIAESFEVPHAFDDWTQLIRADLDLVSITTPPYLHREMALAAAGAGRHILCEKPMALSAAEATAMLSAADAAGVRHVIDHELRFNPNRRKVRALIADGFIGAPRHALITQVGPGRADPSRPWTWWSDAERGGGFLGALGSHQIDLLRYWLGEIAGAAGAIASYVTERPDPDRGGQPRRVTADDFASFTLRFASGAVATVLISAVTAHPRGPRLEVWGAEGTLILDETERLWGARRGRELEELSEAETLAAAPGMDYVPLWGLSFRRLVDHLAEAILDGGPVAPAATFADGLVVQQVMDAIRASAGSARPLRPA